MLDTHVIASRLTGVGFAVEPSNAMVAHTHVVLGGVLATLRQLE